MVPEDPLLENDEAQEKAVTPLPLDQSCSRLKEALFQRDGLKSEGPGVKPKAKGKAKAKAAPKPAAKASTWAAKAKAVAAEKKPGQKFLKPGQKPGQKSSKQSVKKENVLKEKKGKSKKGTSSALKMTRGCVYSRAYHPTKCIPSKLTIGLRPSSRTL